MLIKICVGSSCHLKGSEEIIALFEQAILRSHLQTRVTLSGSFCIGQCASCGVTVQVDDEVYAGVNKENFNAFWHEHVLEALDKKGSDR